MSRSNVSAYIDNQFPDNNQQLIKPLNARNVVKRLLQEAFNIADDDTDDIVEGNTNLFFTLERAADAIAMVIQDSGDGRLTWTYDDVAGTFTPTIDLSGLGGGGSEITDGPSITDLRTQSNWSTVYGGTYSGPAITASEHDYVVAANVGDHASIYKYEYIKVATTLSWVRIPIEIL